MKGAEPYWNRLHQTPCRVAGQRADAFRDGRLRRPNILRAEKADNAERQHDDARQHMRSMHGFKA